MNNVFSPSQVPQDPAIAKSTNTSPLIQDSSTATFHNDVIDASNTGPVLVDFWAPWCGPCRQLGPALEKIITEENGKVRLVKINIDENQELAEKMGVKSIPAVFAFAGGQPVDGFMGALPESELRTFVQKLLASAPPASGQDIEGDMNAQIKQAIDAAQKALDNNDADQAINIFGLILQQQPEHPSALIGLTRAFLKANALDQAIQTLALVPASEHETAEYLSAKSALALTQEAQGLGNIAEIQARIDANPDDHQALLDLAILHNASGNTQEATTALLESIKRDSTWNENAARTKLLEFFDIWGPTSKATITGRKLLSRILFS